MVATQAVKTQEMSEFAKRVFEGQQQRKIQADTYYNRALVKHALSEYAAAVTDFDEAIRLQPDHAGAYLGRGVAKYALSEYADAIRDFDEAIRLQPDNVDAYDYRDIARRALERTE